MTLTNDQKCNINMQAGTAALEVLEALVETAPDVKFEPMDNIAASEATTVATLKTDFNALLAALKAAGLMEADEVTE